MKSFFSFLDINKLKSTFYKIIYRKIYVTYLVSNAKYYLSQFIWQKKEELKWGKWEQRIFKRMIAPFCKLEWAK